MAMAGSAFPSPCVQYGCAARWVRYFPRKLVEIWGCFKPRIRPGRVGFHFFSTGRVFISRIVGCVLGPQIPCGWSLVLFRRRSVIIKLPNLFGFILSPSADPELTTLSQGSRRLFLGSCHRHLCRLSIRAGLVPPLYPTVSRQTPRFLL